MVGEIRVGEEPTNPTVSIQLSGVDTEGIIESAKTLRQPRQPPVQDSADALQVAGHPRAGRDVHLAHASCGGGASGPATCCSPTSGACPTNRCGPTDDWKLIIDFPFDTEGHSPDRGPGPARQVPGEERTAAHARLAPLVLLAPAPRRNWASSSSSTGCCWATTSTSTPSTCRCKTARPPGCCFRISRVPCRSGCLQAVEAAYAIRSEPTPGTLDAAYDMSESHFQSLFPTLVLQRPVGANLGEALEHLLDQALSHQFPKHPKFGQEIKLGKDLRQVLEVCQEAARTPGRSGVRRRQGGAAEAHQHLQPARTGADVRRRTSSSATSGRTTSTGCWPARSSRIPRSADLRRWTDQPEERGLPRRSRTC